MHERRPAAIALEQRDGIGAGLPDPAEVELEPEEIRRQLAEEGDQRAAVAERTQLARVVVEAEAKPELLRVRGDRRDALRPRARVVDRGRGPDPRERDAVRAEHAQLCGERGEIGLERLDQRVPAGGDEAELVQPRAHLPGLVTVQIEDLDALVPERGDRAQDALEIARALVAHGVELEADARHG